MKPTPLPASAGRPPGAPPHAFQALDDLVHTRLADTSLGLSPISLALPHADWAWHLATSPGRQPAFCSA